MHTRPPATEEEERAALIFECGLLTGRTHRLTGHFPAAIKARIESGAGLDIGSLTTAEIAAICNEIRAECPAAQDI